MEISGKTAIVTGAASGIGLGIATALAETDRSTGRTPASRQVRESQP
jgi:NAD(P)-dependent dehydrogenase (short-subunit alcohol dehydrogenase family)